MNIDTSVMLADDLDDEPKPLAAAPRPSLTNLPPPPKRRSSIKDRFEDAKKEQQRVEEERLGKFKHKDVISPKGNVAGMWNSALANSKTNEAERYQAKRRETISQFQTAEAAGIVADRVKHFEELYMQLAASIEKMEATIRAARRNAKKWKMAATSPMRAAKGGPPGAVEEAPGIRIRLGETATFWFDPQYFSYVNAMLAKNRNDPISLPTGVYSDQAAPHIDVVAVCILDTSSNEPYLAITVDYCDGQAGDLLALGQKKIAVFATDHLKGETGVDDLVQVFSEAFVILSREDTGVSAFEMMEEEDEIVEDELAQLSEGLKNSIVDDFNAQDFPQVETAEIDATVGDSLEGKGEEIVLSNSQCAEHCSDEEIDKTLADDNLDSVEKQSDDCLNITLVDSTVDTSIRDENEEEFYAYDAIQEIQVDSATGDELPVAHSAQIQTEVEISPEQYPTEEDSSIGQAMPEAGEVVEIGSPMHRNDSTENVNEVASTPNFHNKDNETSSDDNVTPTSYVSTAHSVSEVDDFIPVDLKSPLSTKNRLKSSSNVGMIFSFSDHGSLAPEVRAAVVIRADSQKVSQHDQSDRKLSWDAKDEREIDLPIVQKVNVKLDLSKLFSVSCSTSCCLFIYTPENIDKTVDSADVQTLAVTGTMKNSVFNSQMIVIDSSSSPTALGTGGVDTVFEWVRDAAFSGWGFKWPMLRQKAGLRTKRFFILRNDLLSYHAREPRSKEEAHADYAMHSLRLRPGSNVAIKRRFFQDCLEVATPVDTLWFKSANKANHSRWMSLIQAAIEHYSRGPVFVTKDRVECAWQHEIPECCCIAVDADVPVLGTFVRISLFRIEVENVKRNSSKGLGSSETNNYTYLIDYNRTGDIEPIVMPLVLEPGIALICLKLIGEDIVLLGGAKGYLGVCDYGDSSVTSRQFEGHSVDVSVTCIATCHARNLAICGDDGGGLSLWMLTASVDRLQCITVVGGESTGRSAVNSIQFVPDRNLIVVSTRLQLLLLGLQVSPDTGRHELEGIRVLDVNSLFVSVCSTVSPIKSLPSFGDDPDSEIFHCHCIAFPNHSAGSSAIRYDFGGLKSNTMSPARSSNEGGEHCSWPLVIWKISGVSALGGAPIGSASLWRIEGNYEWLDENASAMITLGKFAAERMVRRTLSGHLVQHAAEVIDYERNHKNYSVDVDFTVVHQV